MSQKISIPRGFRAGAATAGIKKSGKADVALIVADAACPAAALFTRNACAAPPVFRGRRILEGGLLRGIVVNSGNANAATGHRGEQDCEAMAAHACEAAGLNPDESTPDEFLVCSTGVIGVPLPMAKVRDGIAAAGRALASDAGGWHAASRAIMTTDTGPKLVSAELTHQDDSGRRYSLLGMAKGAGMIHPNMATMLSFLVTDAPLTASQLNTALRAAVEVSFNAITIDGDTSTNDTVAIMASGLAGAPEQPEASEALLGEFETVLCSVCLDLAKMILRDQEGGCKVLCAIEVSGAANNDAARRLARAVAVSPLFKCALHGSDPNWGRVVAALGNAGVPLNLESVAVRLGEIDLLRDGRPLPFDAAAASAVLGQSEATVAVDVGEGPGRFTYYSGDLSEEYVTFNADYRT